MTMNTYTNIYTNTNTDVDKQKHKTLNSLLNFKYVLDSVLNIVTLLLILFY